MNWSELARQCDISDTQNAGKKVKEVHVVEIYGLDMS